MSQKESLLVHYIRKHVKRVHFCFPEEEKRDKEEEKNKKCHPQHFDPVNFLLGLFSFLSLGLLHEAYLDEPLK